MTPANNDYSESALIEKPAMDLFSKLGWSVQNCFHEFDENGKSFLGRETKADVILVSKLKPALQKINPSLPETVLDEAIKILTADRNLMGMVSANREVFDLLKNGILVSYLNNKNEHVSERVQIIDWVNIENNDFFLASQFWISGEMYTRRADLVGFVNGIPLLFMELKASHRNLKKAYDENLRDYKSTIPQVFWFNGVIILSNGSQSRVGTLSAEWDHFSEWKKINDEGEKGTVSLDTVIKGVCEKFRFMDILENYTLFKEEKNGPIKIIAKNHQYLGVEKSIKAFQKMRENKGRLGVFWHTQGSGKTESMIFFSQKILRKIPGNWTFVVVTDRNELDEQTYKRFVRSGVIQGKQEWAETSDDLRRLLKEDHRYVFTTIQKFRTEKGTVHPVISNRSDIIVITDEAHRTQYDIFAMNMRNALPNAGFIAFTGTPLIVGEEKTKEVFGDYVSIYNFKQAIDDKATVPLYYENRKPKVQLVNLNLNEDIQRILENAELDSEQEKKFEREFSKEYQLITREDRLEDIARDIVAHFMNRGFMGKAMVVSIDKATAVKMYNKVHKCWEEYINKLKKELEKAIDEKVREDISNKITYMQQTDMAVVVSQSQNEVEDLKVKGVDITPHRIRMNKEDLAEKFKDADDPLRIVFVCAMWMTGFDVPSCSTIYLDKPMKNHTLMQTIARVNRVFGENKVVGLIVDYIGVLHNLNQALAIYAAPVGTGSVDTPIIAKSELIEQLRKDIKEMKELLNEWKISLSEIMKSEGLDCVSLIDDAIEHILENEERKSMFKEKNAIIQKTYKAILPDTSAGEFQPVVKILQVLADKLGSISPTVDISDVLQQVSELLDKSVKVETHYLAEKPEKYGAGKILDLSKIDIEKLQEEFNKGRKRILAEQLRKAIEVRLHALYMLNKSRINYMERFQKLIDEYNAGSMNVEEYYRRLLEFVKNLDDEEKRALSENLSEEELAVYDLLVNPPLKMTQKEILAVKKIAHDLLEKLKSGKLVLDWRKKQQARASVKLCIEEMLENLPPAFSTEVYRHKCGLIYQHIYESYYGSGMSIYTHQD
ncbi:MAG: type I restriction endonuclease subunit R [Candidatus Goldbacteria bacterium]|nr:type I restriction endonuclease subunit R [Candidatus Goldiibacteriota bacterium]